MEFETQFSQPQNCRPSLPFLMGSTYDYSPEMQVVSTMLGAQNSDSFKS